MKISRLFTILFLIGVYCTLTFPADAADKKIQCSDIASVDFKNLSFEVQRVLFEFHNGQAENYNSPGYVQTDPEDGPPDWGAEIVLDKTISTSSDIPVRFLLINNIHESGSGNDYYFVGFTCSEGTLKNVFSLNGHISLKVEELDSKQVVTSVIPYNKTARKYSSYVWDDTISKYKLNATWENKVKEDSQFNQ